MTSPVLAAHQVPSNVAIDVTGQSSAAVADNSTACLPAFVEAVGKMKSRTSTVLVPAPQSITGLGATPLYRLDEGRFLHASHGVVDGSGGVKGGVLDLQFRIGLLEGPLLTPTGMRVVGTGCSPRNNQTPVSAEIRALANMTRRLEVSALSSSGTVCTVTAKGHDLKVGDVITVSGAANGGFNTAPTATVQTVADANTFTYTGTSSFTGAATGTYKIVTSVRPRVVQLIPACNISSPPATDESGDSARLENLNVHGNDLAGVIGVWSDTMQEGCGLRHVAMMAVHTGVKIVAGQTITPANFVLHDLNVVLSTGTGNAGSGVDIFATKYQLDKATVILPASAAVPCASAYTLRGTDFEARGLHFENADYGVTIGGPGTGVNADNNAIDANISVRGVHGYNANTERGLIAAVRISDASTVVANVEVRKVSINAFNKGPPRAASTPYVPGDRVSISGSDFVQLVCKAGGGGTTAAGGGPTGGLPFTDVVDGSVTWTYVPVCALLLDEVNEIIIPANTNSRYLGYYEFAGTVGVDGAGIKPVRTSYYDSVLPGGCVKYVAAAAQLDRSFPGGARATILQVRGSTTITTISNPFPGAVVILDIQTGLPTLDHQAVTGTATERLVIAGGADITNASGLYRATYGGDPANADRWYVEDL